MLPGGSGGETVKPVGGKKTVGMSRYLSQKATSLRSGCRRTRLRLHLGGSVEQALARPFIVHLSLFTGRNLTGSLLHAMRPRDLKRPRLY